MDTQQALNILGRDPNFSPAELKRAYREQVRLRHPDRYSSGSSLKKVAEKHIQDTNLTYAFQPAGPMPSPRLGGSSSPALSNGNEALGDF